jgi:hypothetical protein
MTMSIFARPSMIYNRKKTISFPQWINYLNALEGGKSLSMGWIKPRWHSAFFWNIFMTCCRRLTKYSSSCPVAACSCTTVQKEIYFPSCKDCTVHTVVPRRFRRNVHFSLRQASPRNDWGRRRCCHRSHCQSNNHMKASFLFTSLQQVDSRYPARFFASKKKSNWFNLTTCQGRLYSSSKRRGSREPFLL